MKLIILDRDGVINHDSDEGIKSVDEWQAIEGSLQAIGRFCQAGYTVAVASNQSGIARGYYDIEILHEMHKKMSRLLEPYGGNVDAIFFCPHEEKDHCQCRKPRPGMLHDIAARYQCELDDVYFIGDSIIDLKTARAAGAKPVLVRTGKGESTMALLPKDELNHLPVYKDLAEAAQAILTENEF